VDEHPVVITLLLLILMTMTVSSSRHERAVEATDPDSRINNQLGLSFLSLSPPSIMVPEVQRTEATALQRAQNNDGGQGVGDDENDLSDVNGEYVASYGQAFGTGHFHRTNFKDTDSSVSSPTSSEESTLFSPIESVPFHQGQTTTSTLHKRTGQKISSGEEGPLVKDCLKTPRSVNWDEETFGDAELHDRPGTWWKYRSSGRVSPGPSIPSLGPSVSTTISELQDEDPFYSKLDYVGDVLVASGFGVALYILCDIMGLL